MEESTISRSSMPRVEVVDSIVDQSYYYEVLPNYGHNFWRPLEEVNVDYNYNFRASSVASLPTYEEVIRSDEKPPNYNEAIKLIAE